MGRQVNSFWTQTFLQDLRDKGLISPDEYHRAVVQLVEFGFHFVSVNQADLFWVTFAKVLAHFSKILAKVLATLAGPDCSLNDAVNVALDVLHEIWADPVPHATKIAFLDLMIQVLVTGRNGTVVFEGIGAAKRDTIPDLDKCDRRNSAEHSALVFCAKPRSSSKAFYERQPKLMCKAFRAPSIIEFSNRLSSQRDERLDADCVENFLETGYRHGLIFRLLVTADNLFAYTQPSGKLSLGDPFAIRIFAMNGAI